MRRLLGDLMDGRELGDTTSLQDDTVPLQLRQILDARRSPG
jgi:acetyl-CoA synthetase